MSKYRIHIPANSHKELTEALQEAANILYGLSNAVNQFDNEGGGYSARMKKKYWKDQADIWKEKYKVIISEEGNNHLDL